MDNTSKRKTRDGRQGVKEEREVSLVCSQEIESDMIRGGVLQNLKL